MSALKIVLTDQVFPSTEVERRLLEAAGARLEVPVGDREAVLAAAEDADGLLNTYFPLGRSDIERLARCRVIARYGIGMDNIDTVAAAERGITVTNVPDYCVEEVAAHTLAMILALLRKLPAAHDDVLKGTWGVGDLRPMLRPSEVTVGLVGFGRIAQLVAAPLHSMRMRIVTHDPMLEHSGVPGVDLVSLDDLLAQSDVVSLHCPLTDQTRGLIGEPQLARMASHAVLVNTSRGPLVRLGDLADALRSGQIAAAGLDVFEQEPPDPELLRGVPGLIVSPHVAYYSESALRESQHKAATQVVKVLQGETPDYLVAAPR